jgi:hypothetical protein
MVRGQRCRVTLRSRSPPGRDRAEGEVASGKVPMPGSRTPSGKVCARAKHKRRCQTMTPPRRPSTKTESACGRRAWHARRPRGRCSILCQTFPMILPSATSTFLKRIRNAIAAAGWKNVREIRDASDATLLSLQDLGPGSVAHLREKLSEPSSDKVRPPSAKKPGPSAG